MNKDEQIALIRAKCIEANPEIEELVGGDGDPFGNGGPIIQDRPIRLTDVLLAIRQNERYDDIQVAKLVGIVGLPLWNLRADDLTLQSDECITFLADLLTKNN